MDHIVRTESRETVAELVDEILVITLRRGLCRTGIDETQTKALAESEHGRGGRRRSSRDDLDVVPQ
jgi:hypothetical protein